MLLVFLPAGCQKQSQEEDWHGCGHESWSVLCSEIHSPLGMSVDVRVMHADGHGGSGGAGHDASNDAGRGHERAPGFSGRPAAAPAAGAVAARRQPAAGHAAAASRAAVAALARALHERALRAPPRQQRRPSLPRCLSQPGHRQWPFQHAPPARCVPAASSAFLEPLSTPTPFYGFCCYTSLISHSLHMTNVVCNCMTCPVLHCIFSRRCRCSGRCRALSLGFVEV